MCDAPYQKQAWKRFNRLIEEWSVTYPDLLAWLEETIAHALAVSAREQTSVIREEVMQCSLLPAVVFTAQRSLDAEASVFGCRSIRFWMPIRSLDASCDGSHAAGAKSLAEALSNSVR